MISNPLRVAVLFGGPSAEHEISLLSAFHILSTLSQSITKPYELIPIGITRQGLWILIDDWPSVLAASHTKLPNALSENDGERLCVIPGHSSPIHSFAKQKPIAIDVVFPIVHGPYGEDGSLQGLLKQLALPFVGGSTLASALSMDKDMMKRILRDSHLPVANYTMLESMNKDRLSFQDVQKQLSLPFYVKPANQGSSIGIHRIYHEHEYRSALEDAFSYDEKVILEENIDGRELECAILGNDRIEASAIGEIISRDGFYSYETKYLDKDGARLEMPAKLEPKQEELLQETAKKAFRALGLHGLARVDMFLDSQCKIIINEVNSLPGFTEISMYPGLWKLSGYPLEKLLERLIDLALERAKKSSQLKLEPKASLSRRQDK